MQAIFRKDDFWKIQIAMQKPGFVIFKVEKFTNASEKKFLENTSNGYKKILVKFKKRWNHQNPLKHLNDVAKNLIKKISVLTLDKRFSRYRNETNWAVISGFSHIYRYPCRNITFFLLVTFFLFPTTLLVIFHMVILILQKNFYSRSC